jgi:hypothetical protein
MGQQFDRVAIVASSGKENVILESQLMVDYGQRQDSQGVVLFKLKEESNAIV